MCTRVKVRTIGGIEIETTEFSGDGEGGQVFLTPLQAAEFASRFQDGNDGHLPEPQVYTHPTTGAEVLEVWEDHFDSHIFHLNDEGYYNVTELSWDD